MTKDNISVLIVDDDEVDRYVLKRVLGKNSKISHIFEAHDGQSAIEFFSDSKNIDKHLLVYFPPALIFLDINMPRKNGFEFLDDLVSLAKQREPFNFPTTIMYSSSDLKQEREKALSYDFVRHYMLKETCNGLEIANIIDSI